jgi:four helix bundle protein
VVEWDNFAKDAVGKQMVKAADSVGANIAESYGRYHFGEKLKFFYYARGSLFETKSWLNRVRARQLMPDQQVQNYADALSGLALQLNIMAKNTKQQHRSKSKTGTAVRESDLTYLVDQEISLEEFLSNEAIELFMPDDITFLSQLTDLPKPQLPNYPITQLPRGERQ